MFCAISKYRTSVLAIGLGSLVVHGGDNPAPSTNQAIDSTATMGQKAQIACLIKNVTTIMGHRQSSIDLLDLNVSRDSEKAFPIFIPALSFMTKNPAIIPSRDGKGVTFDFSGCNGVSGSITVMVDSAPSHENPHYASKTIYDHFQYQDGSNSGSIDGTITLVGTITPGSHTTSSFVMDLLSDDLKSCSTVGGVTQPWKGTLNLHLMGTHNGENSTQMQAWGTVRYRGPEATYGATISPNIPIIWNTSQGTYPLSGAMNWICGNTQVAAVFGPKDGGYTLNGKPQTLTANILANDAPVIAGGKQLTGSDAGSGTQEGFSGANHNSITRVALTGRINDLAVRALVESSVIGDTDPVESKFSRTHFDNCYYDEGVAWVSSNRSQAISAAIRYHSTRSEQDRLAVFRYLGFAIHATEDFYSHSNWVETQPTNTICNFDNPKPSGWFSGTWAFNTSDTTGCHCPSGTPPHTMAGLGMNKDTSDRVGYPGSFQEAYDDAVLAVRDQIINRFMNGVRNANPSIGNQTLMELGFLHPIDYSTISDAIQFPDGRVFFFMGTNYLRYNVASDQVDSGYPKPINGNWPGVWPAGVDAATNWNNGKTYFFRGSEYIRYDMATNRADTGYPKPIAGNWPGLWASGITAAIMWNNGKAYFFRGSEYIRYDIATDRADVGYPKPIAGNWPGLWTTGVDAAIMWNNGKAYFFKGNQYIRYDVATDRADAGYPQPIATNWKGF